MMRSCVRQLSNKTFRVEYAFKMLLRDDIKHAKKTLKPGDSITVRSTSIASTYYSDVSENENMHSVSGKTFANGPVFKEIQAELAKKGFGLNFVHPSNMCEPLIVLSKHAPFQTAVQFENKEETADEDKKENIWYTEQAEKHAQGY